MAQVENKVEDTRPTRQFAIRTSMDSSALDMVMNPSANSLFATKYEFTVKSFFGLAIAFFLLVWLVMQTPLQDSGVLGFVLWLPAYVILTWMLVGPTDTQELGLSYIPTFFTYFNKDRRIVSTRKIAPEANFADIAPIKEVRESDGLILMRDGTCMRTYEVVGNASILMFSQDRELVLRDVTHFYNNVRPQVNLMIDSESSPQRVVDQLNAKDYQILNLQNHSTDYSNIDPRLVKLRELLQGEQIILRDVVGRNFKALHQYLTVRALSEDDLYTFESWLMQVASGSNLYIKTARALEYDETVAYLKSLYSLDL